MINKLITTPEEHAMAIDRLSRLMDTDPAPGNPRADELQLLAHLIEDYEKKHTSVGLPDPLTAIRFRMEQQGLQRKDLVPYLGSQSRVSEVLGGKRQLTVQMIRKLNQGLGIPAEVLVQPCVPPLKPIPKPTAIKPSFAAIKEMVHRGWFGGITTWAEAKKRVDQLLSQFFSLGPALIATPALNRQMPRRGTRCDAAALLCWKQRVLQIASQRRIDSDFRAEAFTHEFLQQLAGLSRLQNGPLAAFELLESQGIATVHQRHLPGTYLDGAALMLPNGTPVIALTLRHDRLDNFWFCLFHELAHVLKHLATGKAACFIDDLEIPARDKCEMEADDFACQVMVPKNDWESFRRAGVFDPITVRREAKRLLIHAAILAGMIRKDRKNYNMLSSLVGYGKVRPLFDGQR